MNTGAEAVETAIKAARRWGYRVKGIARDRAEIVVAQGNFHGRTTTIVGFSSEPEYRADFGPFAPGFRAVPFGDLAAMAAAITPNTAAVLIEPIQGEAGIIVPPQGYLARRPGAVRRPGRAHDPRRGAVRARPHRRLVRLRARERRSRRPHPRQGAGRRRVAGVRLRRPGGADGRVHPGLARLDLRRQSARGRGRPRGAAGHRGRGAGRAQLPRSARTC